MQRAFGETYSDWSSLGRDFRCDAEQEDGDLMLLGDGGEEEENFSLVDFRFSLLRFGRWSTKDSQASPLGGGLP